MRMIKPFDEWAPAFCATFNAIAGYVHATCVEKGFWRRERNPYEMIALMHSELSECVEGLRNHSASSSIPPFAPEEEELADCIIRIMDYAVGRGLHVPEALVAKLAYNSKRPWMHGKTA